MTFNTRQQDEIANYHHPSGGTEETFPALAPYYPEPEVATTFERSSRQRVTVKTPIPKFSKWKTNKPI